MSSSPKEALRLYFESYIEERDLPEDLKREIPKKWEKYGDFVLLDGRSLASNAWYEREPEFWETVCRILKCQRLAVKSKIRSDDFRTPNVKIIVGNDPWITCVDNSIKYSWNVEKNMFCAGNASERHRIAKLNCVGEVVVDLFAGIGYFVLPFLIHANADFVHACDWNPDAVKALKRNLKLNKVEDRCRVHEGDNSIACPRGVADRVNLGLIPSSEKSWRVACEALKPSGGTLHVHGNVETAKDSVACGKCLELKRDLVDGLRAKLAMASSGLVPSDRRWIHAWKHEQWLVWGIHVLHTLMSILSEANPATGRICSVENVHRIKSYAPHVDHLVLDVSIKLA